MEKRNYLYSKTLEGSGPNSEGERVLITDLN